MFSIWILIFSVFIPSSQFILCFFPVHKNCWVVNVSSRRKVSQPDQSSDLSSTTKKNTPAAAHTETIFFKMWGINSIIKNVSSGPRFC